MTLLHKEVDFGAAYLDAGLQGEAGDAAGPVPEPDALALFARHMGDGGGRGSHGGAPGLQDVFDEVFAPAAATAAALPPIGVAADGSGAAAGGEADALLVDAVQSLWVAHGADGRELRMHALGERLADTSLRMLEDAGRLVIEFETPAGESREWLSQRLHGLAAHLGRHLDRPLRVSLSTPAAAQAAGAPALEAVHWPEDFDA